MHCARPRAVGAKELALAAGHHARRGDMDWGPTGDKKPLIWVTSSRGNGAAGGRGERMPMTYDRPSCRDTAQGDVDGQIEEFSPHILSGPP